MSLKTEINSISLGDRVLVLCSGGIDSTALMYTVLNRVGPRNLGIVGVRYGQKHKCELAAMRWHARRFHLPVYSLDLKQVFERCECPLLAHSEEKIPTGTYAEQKAQGIVPTYVPFRNGLFLSAVASLAYSKGYNVIAYGAHADDAAGSAYPDAVAKGSRILMVDGTEKPIEQIKEGDVLWGFNEHTQRLEESVVLRCIDQGIRPTYDVAGLRVSENHLMWVRTPGDRFRRYGDLCRPDTMYAIPQIFYDGVSPADDAAFINGYLRGFLDGDGHISPEGCITLFQKDATVLEEYLVLAGLQKDIHTNNAGCHFVDICAEAPQLLQRIAYSEDPSYMAGYLNGMIIAEGALTVSQSVEVNPDKVTRIQDYIWKLGIHCNTWLDHSNCMNWKFSRAWRLPLRYGAGKLRSLRQRMEEHMKATSLHNAFVPGIVNNKTREDQPCYDLTTTSGTYIANRILVHNCSLSFAAAMAKAIEEGTGGKVDLYAPWLECTKSQVVGYGIEAGMTRSDFAHTWSCYNGGFEPCGVCSTCRDARAALDSHNETRGVVQRRSH